MAITRHSNFDKTVQTIIDRNNISNKVNGMMVVVLDAIADPNAGPGKAIYRWDTSDTSWILVSKSSIDTMNFVTEELTIVNGEVQLSYIPVDNIVWNGVILNGQLIMGDLNLNSVEINAGKISNIESQFNGYKLKLTYAYGTITQQITTAIGESVNTALVNNLKSINGQEIIGTGNIEVTAALPDLKTINNESIIGTGNINIITDISGKADKVDTYTKTEVDAKIVELAPATDISSKADITYVDGKISDLIGLAPSTLDTFKEIADQLAADESAVSALTTTVAGKADKSNTYTKTEVNNALNSKADVSYVDGYVNTIETSIQDAFTAINNKVDKVTGKGLSTEDYTTDEKTKLAGLSNYTKPTSEPISYITDLQTTLDSKIDDYDITTTEFNTGIKRGGKIVYGIEVDFGALPNATFKEVSFSFNKDYFYWIDTVSSYSTNSLEVITIPYVGYIGDEVSIKLDKFSGKITAITAKDRTDFTTTKVVLLYTK